MFSVRRLAFFVLIKQAPESPFHSNSSLCAFFDMTLSSISFILFSPESSLQTRRATPLVPTRMTTPFFDSNVFFHHLIHQKLAFFLLPEITSLHLTSIASCHSSCPCDAHVLFSTPIALVFGVTSWDGDIVLRSFHSASSLTLTSRQLFFEGLFLRPLCKARPPVCHSLLNLTPSE